jgi:hypothetical protein
MLGGLLLLRSAHTSLVGILESPVWLQIPVGDTARDKNMLKLLSSIGKGHFESAPRK